MLRRLRLPATLACLALLAGCVPPAYRAPYPVTAVRLPRDEAAHPAPIEWWYTTGHLTDEQGREYGFELTFFKLYTPPQAKLLGFVPAFWLADKGQVGHFAVTDLSTGRFVMDQRADFWGYDASTSGRTLDVHLGDWKLEDAPIGHHLQAAAGGYALDLRLAPAKPAAMHGSPPGIQSMGPGGVSYYYSYTRQWVSGAIGLQCGLFGCKTLKVTGQAWSDHQWGDFGVTGYAGWDWYSLQFDDDTELMLYLIRMPDGSFAHSAGSYITADGRTLPLAAHDFRVTATGQTWTSPRTGATYPMSWRVRVPAYDIDITVTPQMQAQEMDTRATTGIVYW
ncbi:MAG TPA: lipocalin-like domain-containing protein, partial [Trueperaceae bacterium]